jgi:hypothetical protein
MMYQSFVERRSSDVEHVTGPHLRLHLALIGHGISGANGWPAFPKRVSKPIWQATYEYLYQNSSDWVAVCCALNVTMKDLDIFLPILNRLGKFPSLYVWYWSGYLTLRLHLALVGHGTSSAKNWPTSSSDALYPTKPSVGQHSALLIWSPTKIPNLIQLDLLCQPRAQGIHIGRR